jgi:hypothetical protein
LFFVKFAVATVKLQRNKLKKRGIWEEGREEEEKDEER